ncbi:hypothetical protein PVMG_06174 [Plasmodium vivax Mauritania I]|uniref:Variable surface protein Vir18 n=1 Tax=Plasmodium vivax Mauritania I TaxID=1035515 RepID=A0A0J9TMH1_PLAVI|nr:hypothetical protein PVMG_06174 [Plasmodium vivax Mauritania I]
MMNWFTRKITGPINFYSMYNGARCMNDYTLYKIDIEREIDNLDKKFDANFYQEWEKLKKNIIEKNNKLKECYNKGYITVTLIDGDKINKFMNRCSSNRRCNNPSRQAQITPLSNPETKRSCKGQSGCKEPATPKEAKPNPNPTAAVVASKPINSSRQNSDDQGQSHAAVPGPRTGSVNLKTETSIDHSVPSVIADTQAPEQRDNTQSGVSGQTETPTQSALDSAVEKENVVDPNLSNASSQGISDGGSPSIGNFPLKVLETNKHQGGPHGSKDLSGTALGEHATPVESVEVKTTRDNNCSKTSCAENPTEGTPSSGENCDGHSTQQVTNSVGTDETSVVPRDSVSVDFTTAGPVDLSIDRSSASKGVTNHVTLGSQNTCDDNSCVVDGQGKAVGDKPTDTETLDIDVAVEGPRSEVRSNEILFLKEFNNKTSSVLIRELVLLLMIHNILYI